MRKLLLCLMLIAASCMIFAQTPQATTYTIKGVLLDSLTHEGEPYATIRIVNKEMPTKPVKLAVTGTSGKFQEQITGSGTYIISISSIGRTTVVREFTLADNKTIDLGNLYINDDTKELGMVEVVAQKPLVKVDIDKIEYNIEDDPDSKTSSLLEMLRKVPLVTVDSEDKIQVNGSSSFKVHVNGKPNNMMSNNPTEVLKSMPAHTIKHIEVITNPGAKYDAEGVGGILNIVTVGTGFEGYTVTLGAHAGNRDAGGNVYGTVQKGKLTVTGNYLYSYNDRPRSYSHRIKDFKDSQNNETMESSSKSTGNFQYSNLEGSYEIDTLRLVTLGFGLYGSGGDNNTNGVTKYPLNYFYRTQSRNDNSWYSIRGNIDYQRLFSLKGRMLTFSYRISTQPETSDGITQYTDTIYIIDSWRKTLDLRDHRSDAKTNTSEHTFQADYVTPIGKYHTIETGLKYIIRNNNSDTRYYDVNALGNEVYNEARSVDYKHLNDIFAVYGGYNLRYKDWQGKVGVRYERTMLDVKYKLTPDNNFDKTYSDVVPSASVGLKLGQTKNIRVGYNMRIWRPSIWYLNPFRDTSNGSTIRYGNPDLETEKSHAFNISYSSFTAKFNLNLSLRHSFNNNSIESYTFTGENNITYQTYENIGKSRYTGMSAYVNWNASPKTRIYLNANGGYNVMKSPQLDIYSDGWDLFVYGGVQHTLPYEIRISLNGMGAAPRQTLQGDNSGYVNYGMSVNKSFLKKRLTLSAYANNVFNRYRESKRTTNTPGFTQITTDKYPQRYYGISVSYRIGELKAQVKKAARTISNDDVKSGGDSSDVEGN